VTKFAELLRRCTRLALILLALATPALADQPARDSPANGVLRPLPPPSTTRHEITLDGRRLGYAATAGTLPLRDAKGETTAEIFHVAYTRDPPALDRPVTFVFNGGPGAASAFLNLGAIGPRNVVFAENGTYLPTPAALADNPDSWLDVTDLVFVDPVGTGYSRAAGTGDDAEKRFLGVRQDAEAMTAFVRLYLARTNRTLSPVFLAGESYGGFRAALLAKNLQTEGGIAVNGAVLISPALEFALLFGDEYMPLKWMLPLPSLAAVNLERQGVTGREALETRLRDIERFARTDYLVFLAAGMQAPSDALTESLVRFTGLSPDLVRRHYGRISASVFMKEYDRANGRVLSRYDGSVSRPDPNPADSRAGGPDPVLDRADSVWTPAFVRHVRDELGYATDVTYRLLNRSISGRWDFGTSPNRQGYAGALEDLQAARVLNPALQVLIAHGLTDLITPYFASRYLVDQLPPLAGAAPIELRLYGGGHMMYMRPESRRALKADARALYERALAKRPPDGTMR
jgi:carboxypeptidase C (cathepsin A)